MPDNTPNDTSDNERGAILKVQHNKDGSYSVETTRGNFVVNLQ